MLADYNRAVITLGVAMLGLTVTFFEKLLPDNASEVARWSLGAAWTLFGTSTLAGVISAALCINYLLHEKRGGASILFANVAVFALFLGIAAIGVLGFSRIGSTYQTLSTTNAIDEARRAVPEMNNTQDTWNVSSLEWNAITERFKIRLVGEQSNLQFQVVVSTAEPHVVEIKQE